MSYREESEAKDAAIEQLEAENHRLRHDLDNAMSATRANAATINRLRRELDELRAPRELEPPEGCEYEGTVLLGTPNKYGWRPVMVDSGHRYQAGQVVSGHRYEGGEVVWAGLDELLWKAGLVKRDRMTELRIGVELLDE